MIITYCVRYPLVGISLGWMLGLFVGYASVQPFFKLITLSVGLVVCFAFAFFGSKEKAVKFPILSTLLFIIISFFAGVSFLKKQKPALIEPGVWSVLLQVDRIFHFPDEKKCIVKILEGKKLEGAVSFSSPSFGKLHKCTLNRGDVVRVFVKLKPIVKYRNQSPNSEWIWQSNMQAHLWIPDGIEPLLISKNQRLQFWENTRSFVRNSISRNLGEPYSSLVRSFVLGESYSLKQERRETIRKSGLSHVLAVSGLHVGLFVGVCFFLLQKILLLTFRERINATRWASLLGIFLSLGFAFFAGGAPSAMRASTMLCIVFFALLFYRRPHLPSVLAITILVLTILNPNDAFRPGFLLSILAMVALLPLVFEEKNENGFKFFIRQSFRASTRAFLMTAPIVWWCFGTLPIVGLLTNVLLLPVMSFVLIPFSFLWVSLSLFNIPGLKVFTILFQLLSDVFLEASLFFSQNFFTVNVPPLTFVQGICVFVFCATVVLFLPRNFLFQSQKRFWLFLFFPVAIFIFSEWQTRSEEKPENQLRVTFLDVGQGDATLIDLPDGKLMVVDTGQTGTKGFDLGSQVLVPVLQARRRTHIDVLVITHPHPDHYGGAQALLEHFSIGEIWDNGQAFAETIEGPYKEFLVFAQNKDIQIFDPSNQCNRDLHFGEATIQWVWPCPSHDSGLSLNNNSILLRLSYQNRSFLLTGDLEKEAEVSVIIPPFLEYLKPVDVLKVGHHGSKTSSTLPFLQQIRPQFVVISSGVFNRFGHPHSEILRRFSNLHIPVLRADKEGSVTFRVINEDLFLKTWLDSETSLNYGRF